MAQSRLGVKKVIGLLGPAFVASVAYVDPGNVAANLSAGADYGYLLVWVLVTASLMSMVVQYLSAKLGIVSGSTLPTLIADWLDGCRHGRGWRWLFGIQAFVVAVATDLAEVVGGAIALNLLFGLPTWVGGAIVGLVSLVGLGWLRSHGERFFEVAITVILAAIALGFVAGLVWAPPSALGILDGMVPRFSDAGSVQIAAAMLGATVMPHAIYLHSNLTRDRHHDAGKRGLGIHSLLFVQKVDVGLALVVAGGVNVAMLLFGVTVLRTTGTGDPIAVAHATLQSHIGPLPAIIFGLGLLASSIGSALVGTHAGATMIRDLLPCQLTPFARRALTLIPAVLLLGVGVNATEALVASQLVLSFGIGFALIPLVGFTSSRRVMGDHASTRGQKILYWAIVALVLALNLTVIVTPMMA